MYASRAFTSWKLTASAEKRTRAGGTLWSGSPPGHGDSAALGPAPACRRDREGGAVHARVGLGFGHRDFHAHGVLRRAHDREHSPTLVDHVHEGLEAPGG